MAYGAFASFESVHNGPAPSMSPVVNKLLMGKKRELKAGVADMQVSADPNAVLATYSLGSCIGVTVYDPVARVGGILHYQLPSSSISPEKADLKPYMYADTGIPALFKACIALGARLGRMKVRIAGGADSKSSTGIFNIGPRNYTALRQIFSRIGKPIEFQEIGGFCSRTMWLDVGNGELTLKTCETGYEAQWKIL